MNNDFKIAISSTDELSEVANKLLKWSNDEKVFCFNAQMGAGKTTFIKQLCYELGYFGIVSSPTFPIINNYENIFHIDCYRLKNADEAIQVGMEDCIFSGKYCFIEWADIISEILPSDYIQISIEITGENSRIIKASKTQNNN